MVTTCSTPRRCGRSGMVGQGADRWSVGFGGTALLIFWEEVPGDGNELVAVGVGAVGVGMAAAQMCASEKRGGQQIQTACHAKRT
eukprot:351012-Chlamydomonas_euryale.AAC.2